VPWGVLLDSHELNSLVLTVDLVLSYKVLLDWGVLILTLGLLWLWVFWHLDSKHSLQNIVSVIEVDETSVAEHLEHSVEDGEVHHHTENLSEHWVSSGGDVRIN